jgi:hypothetical protein
MGLFSRKRTISAPLVCLYCPEVNPLWFTKENADSVPFCTACNLQLVPDSFKQVLVTGKCPDSLELDAATGLAATMSAMTILWASLNSTQVEVFAQTPVSWDVWNVETFDEWPIVSQAQFMATLGDGTFLKSEHLGNLADQMPFLATMSSNFLWRVHEDPNETMVILWPKEALSLVNSINFEAIKCYLALVKPPISDLAIWQQIDLLIELNEKNSLLPAGKKLFGFDVVVHSFTGLALNAADGFREHEDFSSKSHLEIRLGSEIDPYGKDVAKRFYVKSDSKLDFELLGPFGLSVRVEDSGTYKLYEMMVDDQLKLIHSFAFKVLASGVSEERAQALVREKLLEKFGFVIKRNGQNWLVDKKRGVDYFEDHSEDVYESPLYSKVIEVRPSSPSDWSGTAWRLRCS